VSDPSPIALRRAERLLRWYPREWRARYGDEFVELLAADIAERPERWSRTVDVAGGSVMAHLAGIGLSGGTVDGSDRSRRSLATFECAVVVFMAFALSMWSQLDIARRSSDPTTSDTRRAIIVMTLALAVCVAATVIATVPVAWTAALKSVRRPELGLRRPVGLFLFATTVLLAGAVMFRHGWAGGAHPWSHASTGPGGAAGVLWASTVAVSAYWVHPSMLFKFPISEIAWMIVSPLAVVAATSGAARTLRRVDLPTELVPFVSVASRTAVAGFGLFVVGTLMWLVDGSPGPGETFQAGTVDVIGLAVMCVTLAVAAQAVSRTSLHRSLTAP
jgi:hypothetical protein